MGRNKKAMPKQARPPAQHARNPRNLASATGTHAGSPLLTAPTAAISINKLSDQECSHRERKVRLFLLTSPFIPERDVPGQPAPCSAENALLGCWSLRVVLNRVGPSEP